jgi:hypothetical protein
MSSIVDQRACSALTGRWDEWEVMGSSLKPKVAGPAMLGIGCPHRLTVTRYPALSCGKRSDRAARPSRESGFHSGGPNSPLITATTLTTAFGAI